MAKLDELFKIMIAQEASDLHLAASAPPFLRVQVGHETSQQEKKHNGYIGVNKKPFGEEAELAGH